MIGVLPSPSARKYPATPPALFSLAFTTPEKLQFSNPDISVVSAEKYPAIPPT